jgi:hypothetical protein
MRTRPGQKPKVLLICGSINQTSQMVQIGRQLEDEYDCWYSPYYGGWFEEFGRRAGFAEGTIAGHKRTGWALEYLHKQGYSAKIDYKGRRFNDEYELVVLCSDLNTPDNLEGKRVLWVQEGIFQPEDWRYRVVRALKLPGWMADTAMAGQSNLYHTGCVASEGYKRYLVERGVPEERIHVTGIPNFDNCEAYRNNDFPYRGYALVCTSDVRELGGIEDRKGFIEWSVRLARGRPMIFKLHPNEKYERAEREIRMWAPPGTLVYQQGSAEQMIANCEVFMTRHSSTVFVAFALGKECYSWWTPEELAELCPVQNGGTSPVAIAGIARELIAQPFAALEAERLRTPRRFFMPTPAKPESRDLGWES